MSTLKVNALNNGGSAIDFPSSFKIGGNPIEQGYTSSATEPTSPNTGDLWWDSANEALYQYLNGEFKAITTELPAWVADLSNFSYDSVSFSVTSGHVAGLQFNPDGTKMYTHSINSTGYREYDLSTAWDVSTASYNNVTGQGSTAETGNRGILFNGDGTKIYHFGQGTDRIYMQSLSTAYDLSTIGYNEAYGSLNPPDAQPRAAVWNNDGTKLFVGGGSNDRIFELPLSTAYDVSTINTSSPSYVNTTATVISGLQFNEDGMYLYASCSGTDKIYRFTLTTAYDITTATEDTTTFSIASQAGLSYGMAFGNRGKKMYVTDGTTNAIYQYSTGL